MVLILNGNTPPSCFLGEGHDARTIQHAAVPHACAPYHVTAAIHNTTQLLYSPSQQNGSLRHLLASQADGSSSLPQGDTPRITSPPPSCRAGPQQLHNTQRVDLCKVHPGPEFRLQDQTPSDLNPAELQGCTHQALVHVPTSSFIKPSCAFRIISQNSW